jgi:hypothetical protein
MDVWVRYIINIKGLQMSDLTSLKVKMIKLYFNYKDGLLSLEEYIQQIKPLDCKIDKLELNILSSHLVDNPVS